MVIFEAAGKTEVFKIIFRIIGRGWTNALKQSFSRKNGKRLVITKTIIMVKSTLLIMRSNNSAGFSNVIKLFQIKEN